MKTMHHAKATGDFALGALCWVAMTLAGQAAATGTGPPPIALGGTPWDRAARAQGIDPALLYALALARTGIAAGGGSAAPWPWTLAIRGRPQRYPSRAQAAAALARIGNDRRGEVEVGLMAIDWRRWRHRLDDPDPAALLEPAANLRLGAAILADSLRATPDDPALAVGHVAYPTDATAARAFGRRVLTIATALGMADPASAPKRRPSGAGGSPGEALARPLIEAAARRHGLDPAFALAVAHTESRFDQAARSPKGARGVMQLMPGDRRALWRAGGGAGREHRRRGALPARPGGALRRRSDAGRRRLQRGGRRRAAVSAPGPALSGDTTVCTTGHGRTGGLRVHDKPVNPPAIGLAAAPGGTSHPLATPVAAKADQPTAGGPARRRRRSDASTPST